MRASVELHKICKNEPGMEKSPLLILASNRVFVRQRQEFNGKENVAGSFCNLLDINYL